MNEPKYPIRLFEAGDRARINEFFDGMGGPARAFFNRADGNRHSALRFFEPDDRDAIRWMMLDGERMIGYVFLWDLIPSIVWLGIAVADDYQGQHLGEQLLETARRWALEHGKGGILLTTHVANTRAQALYERFGFERMGMHTSGEVLYLKRF